LNASSARAGRLLLAGSALAALALAAGCSNSSTSTATTPPATATPAQGGSAPATESGPSGSAGATTAPAASAPATTAAASGAGSAAAGAPACSSRYLRAGAAQPNGAAGSLYLEITFTNLNNAPCTLFGYPGVVLARGTPVTPVGAPADRTGGGATTVTLAPHGVASAQLRIVDALNFPAAACGPVATTWIQVIPPNQTAPLYVSYTSTGCTKSATHLLSIEVVKPGSGS